MNKNLNKNFLGLNKVLRYFQTKYLELQSYLVYIYLTM